MNKYIFTYIRCVIISGMWHMIFIIGPHDLLLITADNVIASVPFINRESVLCAYLNEQMKVADIYI